MGLDLRYLEWLRSKIDKQVLEEGYRYYLERRLKPLVISVEKQYALFAVYGRKTYLTEIKNFFEPSIASNCTCPYFETQYKLCKHIGGAIYYLLNEIEQVNSRERLFVERVEMLQNMGLDETEQKVESEEVIFTRVDLLNLKAVGIYKERGFEILNIFGSPIVSGDWEDKDVEVILNSFYLWIKWFQRDGIRYKDDFLLVAERGQVVPKLLVKVDFDSREISVEEFEFSDDRYYVRYLVYGIEYEADFIIDGERIWVKHNKHKIFDVHYALLKLLGYILEINPLFFRELVDRERVIEHNYFKLYLPKDRAKEFLKVVSNAPFLFDIDVKEDKLEEYNSEFGLIVKLRTLVDNIHKVINRDIRFDLVMGEKLAMKLKMYKGDEEVSDYIGSLYKQYVFDGEDELLISLLYGLKIGSLGKEKRYEVLSVLFQMLRDRDLWIKGVKYKILGVSDFKLKIVNKGSEYELLPKVYLAGKLIKEMEFKDGINFIEDGVFIFRHFYCVELYSLFRASKIIIPSEHYKRFEQEVLDKLDRLNILEK